MNFEELYGEVSPIEQKLKEHISGALKDVKSGISQTDKGNLKDLDKTVAALREKIEEASALLGTLEESIAGFDRKEYVVGGGFSSDIVKECRAQGVDVRELSSMVYEMFPSRISISAETLDTTVDKKRVQCLRPSFLVSSIRANQQKLQEEPFNPERFLNDLEAAYDTVLLRKKSRNPHAEIKVWDIYNQMVPMARSKKEYDKQAFAFDLARLYAKDFRTAKDGRVLSFDTQREFKDAVRFLDANGHEVLCAVISFL